MGERGLDLLLLVEGNEYDDGVRRVYVLGRYVCNVLLRALGRSPWLLVGGLGP